MLYPPTDGHPSDLSRWLVCETTYDSWKEATGAEGPERHRQRERSHEEHD